MGYGDMPIEQSEQAKPPVKQQVNQISNAEIAKIALKTATKSDSATGKPGDQGVARPKDIKESKPESTPIVSDQKPTNEDIAKIAKQNAVKEPGDKGIVLPKDIKEKESKPELMPIVSDLKPTNYEIAKIAKQNAVKESGDKGIVLPKDIKEKESKPESKPIVSDQKPTNEDIAKIAKQNAEKTKVKDEIKGKVPETKTIPESEIPKDKVKEGGDKGIVLPKDIKEKESNPESKPIVSDQKPTNATDTDADIEAAQVTPEKKEMDEGLAKNIPDGKPETPKQEEVQSEKNGLEGKNLEKAITGNKDFLASHGLDKVNTALKFLGLDKLVHQNMEEKLAKVVYDYQNKNGLKADGILGPDTLKSLGGDIKDALSEIFNQGDRKITDANSDKEKKRNKELKLRDFKESDVTTELPDPYPDSGYIRDGKNQKFGRPEAINNFINLSSEWHKLHPETNISVNAISNKGGGTLEKRNGGQHKSHKIGLDFDISLRDKKNKNLTLIDTKNGNYTEGGSTKLTKEFIDFIKKSQLPVTHIGFQDKAAGGENWPGHSDHIHVRFLYENRY